ncbi:3'-5' exonuclease-like [Tasmannia lanceolata]|uniref:3'-5' exonuclease-like n=1 Tax=Tasmannia lanceolata TaxID=3420 RepID=UPI00406302CA
MSLPPISHHWTGLLPPNTHDFYTVRCFGRGILTTVTNTASVVKSWLSEIGRIHRRRLRHLIVGLDIEWRPNHQRNVQNPVAILQLCVGHRCLIFQIIHADYIPQSLCDFLSNPDFNFVGVEINADVEKLMRDYGLPVSYTTDLRSLAADETGMKEMKRAGLKTLANSILGFDVEKPKSIQRSWWDNWNLFPDQVRYACIDAFLSFEIGKQLVMGEWLRDGI